jgi:hypothetical protein
VNAESSFRQVGTGDRREATKAAQVIRFDLAACFVVGLAIVAIAQYTEVDLPAYLKTLAAFLVLILLPGAALWRLLGAPGGASLPIALACAVPFGVLALVPAAAVGFVFELSMPTALIIGVVTGGLLVLAAASPLAPAGTPMRYALTPGEETLLMVLLLVVLSPVWLRVDLSRDFDDWWYLGYVSEYSTAEDLAPRDPMGGPDGPLSARVAVDVWLFGEGAVTRLADQDALYVVQDFLPPVLLAAMILAVFALARRLLDHEDAALVAVVLVALMAAIDLVAHEGVGRSLVVRSAQDKVVSGFLGVPVFLICLYEASTRRTRRSFIALVAISAALVVIHPHGLVLALAAAVGFLALEVAADDFERVPKRMAALLLVAAVVIVVVPATIWLRVADQSPSLFDSSNGPRLEFRVIDLPAGLYMAHPGVFRNPLLLLAIFLSVFYVTRWRKDRAARLLLAATWVPVILVLFPPTAVVVGRVVSPAQLWRFAWLIPVGPILGQAVMLAYDRFRPEIPRRAAMAAVLAGVAAFALVAQEGNEILDSGFYTAIDVEANSEDLAIMRGLDYLADGSQRATSLQRQILRAAGRRVPRGEKVLADIFLSRALPAFSPGLIPAAPGATPRSDPASRDRDTILERRTPRNLRVALLRRYNLRYIIAPANSTAELDLSSMRGTRRLAGNARYVLLGIEPPTAAPQPDALFGPYALWRTNAETQLDDELVIGITLGTTWTSASAPAAGDQVVARLIDPAGNAVESLALTPGFSEPSVPFSHRFVFAVPYYEGTYRLVAGITSGGTTDEHDVATVTLTYSPRLRPQITIRPVEAEE